MLHAHTEIFFPKLLSVAELPTTGVVLLNPDPLIATVNVYLISADGKVAARADDLKINPGGQVAKLGSELFPNAVTGGWIYVLNDTEGMQAFWLSYDSSITFLDGADAFGYDTIGPDQIIPLVNAQTELHIINPGFAIVPVTVRLFGDAGELATPFGLQLQPAGAFQTSISAIFPAVDLSQARYIRLQTAGAQIASSAVIRGFIVPSDSAVVNGVNASTRKEVDFPHVISGSLASANYTTIIGLTNLANSEQTVTFTFNPEAGDPISVTRTLARNGAIRETAQSLFGLPSTFQGGWVSASGTAALSGVAAYVDTVAGGLAAVPSANAQTNLFFSHIADGPPQWQTGIALVNSGAVPANVELYAMDPSGLLIGSATFTLDPRKKTARALHEWIGQARGVNGGFVYVRTTNNMPLFGIELFYTEDLKVLSNVAAGKLVDGVKYVPPSP
jgi:hypothetical protein